MFYDKHYHKIMNKDIKSIIKGKNVFLYGDSTRNGQLFDLIGKENISCIIDKDEKKHGMDRESIPIYSSNMFDISKEIVVFTVLRDYKNLHILFKNYGIEEYFFVDTKFGERYLNYFYRNDMVAEINQEFNEGKKYKYINFIPDNKFIEPLFCMLTDYFDVSANAFIIYDLDSSNIEDRYRTWDLYKQWSDRFQNIFLIDNIINLKQKSILGQLETINECIFQSEKILLHSGYFSLEIEDFFYSHLETFQNKAELIGWSNEYKFRRLDGKKRIYGECKYIYNNGGDDFSALAKVYKLDKKKEKRIPNFSGYSYYKIPSRKKTGNLTKILLGFGARKEISHIEAIDIMKKFKDKEIEIYCPLSYGDLTENEIMEIENLGNEVFGSKFISLRQYINYQEFPLFINDMDIVILPIMKCIGQTTIRLAMLCNKKIYVKNKEKTCAARMESGYKFYDYEDIEMENFNDFINYSYREKNEKIVSEVLNIQNRISDWKQVYNL